MKYTFIEIKNFKGIENVRLDFDLGPKSNVYTLVGLNESGKTTILEGINLLTYREDLDPLNLPGQVEVDIHDLIPISKRSNFNDTITIKVGFRTNDDDEKIISKYAEELDYKLIEPVNDFTITQSYSFKNSKAINPLPKITWFINLKGKKKRQKIGKKISGDDWVKIVNQIKLMLPRVLYFPNFLFEFPDKIYLENAPQEPERHKFYCTILQDVLDAIGEKTNLEDHILSRAKSSESSDKRSMESVLLKMGAHITKTVFLNWNKIFKRSMSNKEIIVDIDSDEKGVFYILLRLKDGSDIFSISERSLGFRWFFAFLLLTQYRGFRSSKPNNVIFLFDEPASNLHSSAQSQLLESFNNLPKECYIVYTTHSHHMINPIWLEGTFVVKNEGLTYELNEDDFNAKKTIITLHRYREFAVNHPDQTTYFQPVLDVLDYSPSKLENVPNVLMLEGKNDFYTLKYILFLLNKNGLNILPGTGAGNLTNVIQHYLAWGKNFIIILDSDSEGKIQKKRYEDIFGKIIQNKIYMLSDINTSWKNIGMERIFTKDERLAIQKMNYPNAVNFKKLHFSRSIQELLVTKKRISISNETESKFNNLISFVRSKLNEN